MNLDIEKIIREHIDKTVHMSLGTTTKDGKPWVCEVHFAYDDDLNLYFVSKVSTRHCTEIAENPNVAGNIVRQHSLVEPPGGIYFEGTAQVVDNPSEEQIDTYCTRLKRDKDRLINELKEENGKRMYQIKVVDWAAFGKFGDEPMGKHVLNWSGANK